MYTLNIFLEILVIKSSKEIRMKAAEDTELLERLYFEYNLI